MVAKIHGRPSGIGNERSRRKNRARRLEFHCLQIKVLPAYLQFPFKLIPGSVFPRCFKYGGGIGDLDLCAGSRVIVPPASAIK